MSQLNKTETDVEPLTVTVRKQPLQTEWAHLGFVSYSPSVPTTIMCGKPNIQILCLCNPVYYLFIAHYNLGSF